MNAINTLKYLRRNVLRWNGLLLYNGPKDWISMTDNLLELIHQKEISVRLFGNNHFIVLGTTKTTDTWLKSSSGLDRFDSLLERYPCQTQLDIKQVMEVFTSLRKTGKMLLTVKIGILVEWERFRVDAVVSGVSTYLGLGDYSGDGRRKDEKYCTGIIRNDNKARDEAPVHSPVVTTQMPTAVPDFETRMRCNDAVARRLQELVNPSMEDIADITREIEHEHYGLGT